MRHHLVRTLVLACSLTVATTAFAQTGRVGGTVKDDQGNPLKGATITAENPNASPSSFTASSDDKGRWSIIGMRGGQWTFRAEAPGFAPSQGAMRVNTIGAPNPPVNFTLIKGPAPGGVGGALAGVNAKIVQADLEAADKLFQAGQYDQAIAAYEAILQKVPPLTIINLQIGNAHRMKKDYDKAIAAYELVLKGDPTNEKAKIQIGMTKLEKGDMAGAETALTEAAQSLSASREVFYNLGEVKSAKGETDEAIKYYQKAVDTDPTWMRPVLKLGLAYVQKGDTATAIKHLEKVVAGDPTGPDGVQAALFLKELKRY